METKSRGFASAFFGVIAAVLFLAAMFWMLCHFEVIKYKVLSFDEINELESLGSTVDDLNDAIAIAHENLETVAWEIELANSSYDDLVDEVYSLYASTENHADQIASKVDANTTVASALRDMLAAVHEDIDTILRPILD